MPTLKLTRFFIGLCGIYGKRKMTNLLMESIGHLWIFWKWPEEKETRGLQPIAWKR